MIMKVEGAEGNRAERHRLRKNCEYWRSAVSSAGKPGPGWRKDIRATRRRKNKCGLGQPPGPHCYRGRSELLSSARAKDHRAAALRRVQRIDAPLRLTLQDKDSTLPSFLEEGLLRRPRSLGTSALDMRRISPGDSLSWSPTALNPCFNSFRTSHAF